MRYFTAKKAQTKLNKLRTDLVNQLVITLLVLRDEFSLEPKIEYHGYKKTDEVLAHNGTLITEAYVDGNYLNFKLSNGEVIDCDTVSLENMIYILNHLEDMDFEKL